MHCAMPTICGELKFEAEAHGQAWQAQLSGLLVEIKAHRRPGDRGRPHDLVGTAT